MPTPSPTMEASVGAFVDMSVSGGEQGDAARSHDQAGEGDRQREGRRDHCPEGEQQDDERDDHADHLRVATDLLDVLRAPARRTRPGSRNRSSGSVAASRASSASVPSKSVTWTSYCTESTAV